MARPNSRSLLVPLAILFIILSGGNAVVAALFLSHAPTVVSEHAGVVMAAWVLFFLLQYSAPIIQLKNLQRQFPPPRVERVQWFAYAAMGILSTMFATTQFFKGRYENVGITKQRLWV